VPDIRSWVLSRRDVLRSSSVVYRILYHFLAALARLAVRSGRSKELEIIVLRLWVPETLSWLVRLQFGTH
jgi:hypothetical protein